MHTNDKRHYAICKNDPILCETQFILCNPDSYLKKKKTIGDYSTFEMDTVPSTVLYTALLFLCTFLDYIVTQYLPFALAG